MDKRYQVFVSSTYADLKEERQRVIQTLMEMDCFPAGMELFPAADEEQWNFIQRVIDDCDYYILIIGGRYGSVTPDGISYTEKEFDYAKSKGIHVLAFVHENPGEIPAGKSDLDADLRQRLEEFRQKVQTNRLVRFWTTADELPGLVALSLNKTIKAYPSVGWVRAKNVASAEVLSELNELRKENERLRERINDLESQEPPAELKLAAMDEAFELRLEWRERGARSGRYLPKDLGVSFSWQDMFAAIAPSLAEHPNDSRANHLLADALFRKHHGCLGAPDHISVAKEHFETIRVQFETLGLIATRYSESKSGHMALFWSATPRGKREMVRLRTVATSSGDTG